MNEDRTSPTPELDEDELRRLLETAGPRPPVPPEELAAIKAAAREDWRSSLGRQGRGHRRGRWRMAAPLALAATLVIALVLGLWWRVLRSPAGSATVATIERVRGTVRAEGVALETGAELAAGSEIATASGDPEPAWVTLRLVGAQSVRLRAGSRLRLVDGSALELLEGAVYVDSAVEGQSLEVRTPLGNVRDVGTQFEVRLGGGGGSLRIRVREGAVELRRGAEIHSAVSGEEVTLDRDGALERRAITPWHDDWEWVLAAAPSLEVEDPSLDDFLAWLSRETGWRIRFEDDALAASAAERKLGLLGSSLAGLSPADTVVVVQAMGLDYRLDRGVLLIERR